MKPYAELLEFNQPNPVRKEGFTRIRDQFKGLHNVVWTSEKEPPLEAEDVNFFDDPERIIEFAGRWDYGENNANKLGETSKVRIPFYNEEGNNVQTKDTFQEIPIIQKYINMGHESMVEMGDATFFIECSRVVSHELVRHRPCSYQQESQRFVKYDKDAETDIFYMPDGLDEKSESVLQTVYEHAFQWYRHLRAEGVAPQLARYALPNSFRTRLVMKTNVREWRHILKLRMDKSAQPEMQELMTQIYDQLVDVFPNALHGVFDGDRGVR